MNILIVSGNLTREPEMRKTLSGNSVANCTIAVTRSRKTNGEREADFIDFSTFGQSADYLCQYAHKGNKAELVGRLESRKYTDKQGNTRTIWEMIADQVTVYPNKEVKKQEPLTPENAYYDMPSDDSLPF